jgi:Cu/Ag efflux protein CusF
MHRRFPIVVLLASLLFVACGGATDSEAEAPAEETTVYEVRGQFVMFQYGGEAIRVDHEEIPGFMAAMRMDFRPKDPAEVEGLKPGDKIAFRYVVGEKGSYIEGVEVLPPETELELPAGDMH